MAQRVVTITIALDNSCIPRKEFAKRHFDHLANDELSRTARIAHEANLLRNLGITLPKGIEAMVTCKVS